MSNDIGYICTFRKYSIGVKKYIPLCEEDKEDMSGCIYTREFFILNNPLDLLKVSFYSLKDYSFYKVNALKKDISVAYFEGLTDEFKVIEKINIFKFIREHISLIDSYSWTNISRNYTLSINHLREFKDVLNWHEVSIHQELEIDCLREFKDLLDWYEVSSYQTLSHQALREFKYYVIWWLVSSKQKLGIEDYREFKQCLDWELVLQCQCLSDETIEEFKHLLF